MSCDYCKDRKPGEHIKTTTDLKCVHCGEPIKFQVPGLFAKSFPKELLKAAEILEKKAMEIDLNPCHNPKFTGHAATMREIAKALRGEE